MGWSGKRFFGFHCAQCRGFMCWVWTVGRYLRIRLPPDRQTVFRVSGSVPVILNVCLSQDITLLMTHFLYGGACSGLGGYCPGGTMPTDLCRSIYLALPSHDFILWLGSLSSLRIPTFIGSYGVVTPSSCFWLASFLASPNNFVNWILRALEGSLLLIIRGAPRNSLLVPVPRPGELSAPLLLTSGHGLYFPLALALLLFFFDQHRSLFGGKTAALWLFYLVPENWAL